MDWICAVEGCGKEELRCWVAGVARFGVVGGLRILMYLLMLVLLSDVDMHLGSGDTSTLLLLHLSLHQ